MKKIIINVLVLFTLGFSACELIDPTNVDNPNVTDDTFANTPRAIRPWINGLERQLAQAMNFTVQFTELASDNYYNNRTLSSKVFDIPRIEFFDPDVKNMQREWSRLHEMATFGLTDIAPKDASTTDDQMAELHFFKGLASLYIGELFTGFPTAALGEVKPSADHLRIAIDEFTQAINTSKDAAKIIGYRLAIARAYYDLGDRAKAVEFANQVIAANPQYLRSAQFDRVGGIANEMELYLYTGQDEFQPLPRLDFLDPKYFTTGPTDTKPIAILKAEEAYLILAEAQIADNNLPNAKTTMKSLLEQIAKRPVSSINDRVEGRGRRGGTRQDYPDSTVYTIAFGPGEPFVAGLVLNRKGANVSVPAVSGTSANAAEIDAVMTEEAALELLYRMRQEIFIAESRRIMDLGIKFPLSELEINNNPAAAAVADTYSKAQIPSFIPDNTGMDDFSADRSNFRITIAFNMNKVLVQNRTSPLVLPFH